MRICCIDASVMLKNRSTRREVSLSLFEGEKCMRSSDGRYTNITEEDALELSTTARLGDPQPVAFGVEADHV